MQISFSQVSFSKRVQLSLVLGIFTGFACAKPATFEERVKCLNSKLQPLIEKAAQGDNAAFQNFATESQKAYNDCGITDEDLVKMQGGGR
jgi:hypothetical protein